MGKSKQKTPDLNALDEMVITAACDLSALAEGLRGVEPFRFTAAQCRTMQQTCMVLARASADAAVMLGTRAEQAEREARIAELSRGKA